MPTLQTPQSNWPAGGEDTSGPNVKNFSDGTTRQYNPSTGVWEIITHAAPKAGANPIDDAYKQAQIDKIYADIARLQQQPGDSPEDIAYKQAQTDYLRAQIAKLQEGPQAPQRAPRYPEEVEMAQLQIEKLRRDLQDPMTQAFQQRLSAIQAVQQQIAAGQITPDEGNRLIALSQANLDAALQGTTPWQMEQAKTQAKRQQEMLANDFLQSQLSAGTGMASNLLSGAGSIYGKILSSAGPPTNFDPLSMAKGFVGDLGGGPEMSELAKAIMRGALQPQAQGGM